jgi:predicted ester cyclase
MSTAENNIRLIHYLSLQMNQRNVAVIDALFSPHFVSYDIPPGQPNGIAGLRQNLAIMWTAFPDYQSNIELAVAEGSKVAVFEYFQGTHLGQFITMPPTGRRVAMRTAGFYEIHENRIVAQWGLADTITLFRQLQTPS